MKMKILVMSDSHRNTMAMGKIKDLEQPDLILHLGDHESDCDFIFYDIRNLRVRGNCDHCSDEPDDRFLDLHPAKIWMTHGHLYGVKSGIVQLRHAALDKGANIALFGHTHKAFFCDEGNLIIMNPGTPNKSYGIITIDNNTYDVELKYV